MSRKAWSDGRATIRGDVAVSAVPTVWAAFVRQGRWKSWTLAASFCLNFLLVIAAIELSRRPPDVVLVGPEGKSTYVNRSVAGEALTRFLEEQRFLPSDVTVMHFTSQFLTSLLAVNSSTIEASWEDALAFMTPSLRDRMAAEAASQKLVETYRLARVRTRLEFEQVALVERRGEMLHVRAVLRREKGSLDEHGQVSTDRLRVDLVERAVPRTPSRPDGLEIIEYRNQILPVSDTSESGNE